MLSLNNFVLITIKNLLIAHYDYVRYAKEYEENVIVKLLVVFIEHQKFGGCGIN